MAAIKGMRQAGAAISCNYLAAEDLNRLDGLLGSRVGLLNNEAKRRKLMHEIFALSLRNMGLPWPSSFSVHLAREPENGGNWRSVLCDVAILG